MEQYKDFWNSRYKKETYAYGKFPNDFFKECLEKMAPGSILLPADGEGRNGVFAAELGWDVTSLDLSIEGRVKALQLASERRVSIKYLVGDLEDLDFPEASFDAIGLIYAHFSQERKSLLHKKLHRYLKPGGMVILEGFRKEHLDFVTSNPKVGGPREIDMLFSKEELLEDFQGYEVVLMEEVEPLLEEGEYHMGKGAVVRFLGRK